MFCLVGISEYHGLHFNDPLHSMFLLSIKALVSPENWTGKKGKHLKRILTEAHDAAIILINPTDADKFLQASANAA